MLRFCNKREGDHSESLAKTSALDDLRLSGEMDGDISSLFAPSVLPRTSVVADDNAESRASDDDDDDADRVDVAADAAAERTLKIE